MPFVFTFVFIKALAERRSNLPTLEFLLNALQHRQVVPDVDQLHLAIASSSIDPLQFDKLILVVWKNE
jgi:hypothetical protein